MTTRFTWLIEWPHHTDENTGGPLWWGPDGWVKNAFEAVPFSTEEAAKVYLAAVPTLPPNFLSGVVITEHGFDDGKDEDVSPSTGIPASGIWPDFIAPAQYENAHPNWVDPALPDFRKIWAVARECGYAVGLHGSMRRDVDLIAMPWIDSPREPQVLIAELCKALKLTQVDKLELKPAGRIAVNLAGDGWFKLIDLSIMPVCVCKASQNAAARHYGGMGKRGS